MRLESTEGLAIKNEPIRFQSGNKLLFLTVSNSGYVYTTVRTIKGEPRVPGATTDVYRQARDRMQELATERNSKINYTFTTGNRKLIKWADDPEKGRGIFDWDAFHPQANGIVATKAFYPLDPQALTGNGSPG